MYRIGIKALLGVSLVNGKLHIDPCVPRTWSTYEVLLSRRGSEHLVTVDNPDGVTRGVIRIEVDGQAQEGSEIPLARDERRHIVHVLLGRSRSGRSADGGPSASER